MGEQLLMASQKRAAFPRLSDLEEALHPYIRNPFVITISCFMTIWESARVLCTSTSVKQCGPDRTGYLPAKNATADDSSACS